MKFENKNVMVTGSASGLGFAIAKRFLQEGANVIFADVQIDKLKSTVENLSEKYGNRSYYANLDVRDVNQIAKVFQEIKQKFGPLDILVNSAGGGLGTPITMMDISEQHWDLVVDVNLKGTFFCCKEALKQMIPEKSGRIINVSSIGARIASPVSGPHYAASKGGIISMTRRLAMEAGKYNITVNAIAPGTVISGKRMENVWNQLSKNQQQRILDSIPLNRISNAEDQVSGVLFLASEEASYLTGITLDINGGRFMG